MLDALHVAGADNTRRLALTGLTVPQAVAADPAPTDVQISWADGSRKAVRVTWSEVGTQANKVTVRYSSGEVIRTLYAAPDAPDVLDIPTSSIAFSQATTDATLQIGVAVGTSAGESSPAGLSPQFDTNGPVVPMLDTYSMSGSSTLNVKWRPWIKPDRTPNDPLDVANSDVYTPQYEKDGRRVLLRAPGTGTTLTFTGPRPPFEFTVLASNEWSTERGAQVRAWSAAPTATIPAWVKADTAQHRISGTFHSWADQPKVILQARNSATSPWYTVGSQNFPGDTYAFALGAAGSRQYRVQLPNAKRDVDAFFGGFSRVVSTTVQTNASASFWSPTIRVGQTSRAALYLRPNLVGHARLERWNGKAWTLVGPVPIANGLGFGYIRGATPGRVAYRYYVPSGYLNGQFFAAAYTPNFVLTTTR